MRVSHDTFYHSILSFVVRLTQIRDLVVLEELDLGTDLFNVFFIVTIIIIFHFLFCRTLNLPTYRLCQAPRYYSGDINKTSKAKIGRAFSLQHPRVFRIIFLPNNCTTMLEPGTC